MAKSRSLALVPAAGRGVAWVREGEKGDRVTAGNANYAALASDPSNPLTLADAAPAFWNVGAGEPLLPPAGGLRGVGD